jgi:uroporphyrinogen-III synthase
VLLPRAKVARDVFPSAIRAAGGVADVVVAYETKPVGDDARDALRAALASGDVDVVTLTASSTAENLVQALGDDATTLLAKPRVACIGSVTAATATRLGLRVDVVADVFTLDGLLDALEARLRR